MLGWTTTTLKAVIEAAGPKLNVVCTIKSAIRNELSPRVRSRAVVLPNIPTKKPCMDHARFFIII